MRIVCDFDGTITRQDTTDVVLAALAAPEWNVIQADWLAGRISAAECMTRQIALIGGSDDDLHRVLDAIELDPGFAAFVDWAYARGLPISVASDGVDHFIARILGRHDLGHLPTVANRLAGTSGARRLEQPWRVAGCAAGSGVCKCRAAAADAAHDATLIYVGDGRSDFCVAGHADILFAKGALAEYAIAQQKPYLPFDTFHDVRRTLEVLLGDRGAKLATAATN